MSCKPSAPCPGRRYSHPDHIKAPADDTYATTLPAICPRLRCRRHQRRAVDPIARRSGGIAVVPRRSAANSELGRRARPGRDNQRGRHAHKPAQIVCAVAANAAQHALPGCRRGCHAPAQHLRGVILKRRRLAVLNGRCSAAMSSWMRLPTSPRVSRNRCAACQLRTSCSNYHDKLDDGEKQARNAGAPDPAHGCAARLAAALLAGRPCRSGAAAGFARCCSPMCATACGCAWKASRCACRAAAHHQRRRGAPDRVLQNLLSNAAKYNDKAEKWIEVGYQSPTSKPAATPGRYVFYTRQRHWHPRKPMSRYFAFSGACTPAIGGGTGAGLTIARKSSSATAARSGWNRNECRDNILLTAG